MEKSNKILQVDVNSLTYCDDHLTRKIFSNVKFSIDANSIFAIIGKNGTGKTTLLKLILNLLNNNFYNWDGNILLNDVPILACGFDQLKELRRNKVRLILQDAVNCFDPLKKMKFYFTHFYELNELDELLDYFLLPPKNNILEFYPYELSGGMAQRLAIIWGILAKPQLLILDEPNSALDLPLSNLLSRKLKELKKYFTMLIVTQDIDFAINTSENIYCLTESGLHEIGKNNFQKDSVRLLLLKDS